MKTTIVALLVLLMAAPLGAQTLQPPVALPDFDEKAFYQCAWVACTIAAASSWLFGPAAFATGCTAGMLSCAARTAGMLDINNPDEVARFAEAFNGLCQRQINDTQQLPFPTFGFGLQSPQ